MFEQLKTHDSSLVVQTLGGSAVSNQEGSHQIIAAVANGTTEVRTVDRKDSQGLGVGCVWPQSHETDISIH